MKRVLIGGMQHETNMFNPTLTGLDQFRIRSLFFGEEIVARRRGTNSEAGGFIDSLERMGLEIVPSALGVAMPSGMVTEEVFDVILNSIYETLDRERVDGILLTLHGAMVGLCSMSLLIVCCPARNAAAVGPRPRGVSASVICKCSR